MQNPILNVGNLKVFKSAKYARFQQILYPGEFMKNYLKTLIGAATILAFTVSSAYSGMGVSLMLVRLKQMVQKLKEQFQE